MQTLSTSQRRYVQKLGKVIRKDIERAHNDDTVQDSDKEELDRRVFMSVLCEIKPDGEDFFDFVNKLASKCKP
jgi:hypothetical protein